MNLIFKTDQFSRYPLIKVIKIWVAMHFGVIAKSGADLANLSVAIETGNKPFLSGPQSFVVSPGIWPPLRVCFEFGR